MADRTETGSLSFSRRPAGAGFRLDASLWLPADRDTVFDFFSDAHQLEILTPPWLHFCVLTPRPIDMHAGLLIDYRLRLHGVPLRWQSKIDAWDPPHRFVDMQLRGPYRLWRHEHRFVKQDGGTLCQDVVDYDVPGGSLVERFLVRPDLAKIFAFRRQKMEQLFAGNSATPAPVGSS